MKNGQVGERVRMYTEEIPQDGIIIEVKAKRSIKVLWDCDKTKTWEHESQLIRLVPKKRVSREALANFWNGRFYGHARQRAYDDGSFNELCELVGAK